MHATINTFPPLHAMTEPRGWILAAIVLLHVGFFALLSSSMGQHMVQALRPSSVLFIPAPEPRPQLPPSDPTPVDIHAPSVSIPAPQLPTLPEPTAAPNAPRVQDVPPQPASNAYPPQISLPEIDPRLGLSQPSYPASEIRAGHSGTVLLSVHVLENGRVGEVRLVASSGHPKLDESALREARRWRFKPGLRDGVPVAMWRQVPVTFRLEGGARF